MRFQHAELVDKKEKLSQLKNRIDDEESSRVGYLQLARDALRSRRERKFLRNSKAQLSHKCNSDSVEKMKKMLLGSENIALFTKIHRLVEKKSDDQEDEVSILQIDSNSLKRRIHQYKSEKNTSFRSPSRFEITLNTDQ